MVSTNWGCISHLNSAQQLAVVVYGPTGDKLWSFGLFHHIVPVGPYLIEYHYWQRGNQNFARNCKKKFLTPKFKFEEWQFYTETFLIKIVKPFTTWYSSNSNFVKKTEGYFNQGGHVVFPFKWLMTPWDVLAYFSNILARNVLISFLLQKYLGRILFFSSWTQYSLTFSRFPSLGILKMVWITLSYDPYMR